MNTALKNNCAGCGQPITESTSFFYGTDNYHTTCSPQKRAQMTDEQIKQRASQAAYDRGLQAMQNPQAAPGSLLVGMNNTHDPIKPRAAEIVAAVWDDPKFMDTEQEIAERALREGMSMRVPELAVVGPDIPFDCDLEEDAYKAGWNACRAAMLKETGNG